MPAPYQKPKHCADLHKIHAGLRFLGGFAWGRLEALEIG
jgi:hypothetical protein